MNKQKFTNIVKEYHSISADDRNKLHELVNSYPYSQIIHTLVAKANIDANTDIAKQTLAYAAMYSADRSVLKEIIASKSGKREQAPVAKKIVPTSKEPQQHVTAKESKDKPAPQEAKETRPVSKSNKITIDPSIFRIGEPRLSETIMKDLDDLRQSKASYHEWLKLPDKKQNKSADEKEKPTKKTTKAKSTSAKKGKTKPESKPAVKKTESVKTKTPKTTGKKTSAPAKKAAKKTEQKKEQSDKASLKKPDQSKIIEKFIAKEPSITAKASRKSPENQEDLSIASTSFNEDLVSENLARILVSQGKTDKAVDIYKKLIWKFPQKKAYFAAQIEELKKQ